MTKPFNLHPVKVDYHKVLEAILYLIHQAYERKIKVTQYDIGKTLFLSDKAHLNKYGRPVVFDNYVAMKAGPVPSFAYGLLKKDATRLAKVGGSVPWRSEPAPEFGENSLSYHSPARDWNRDLFSETDLEELNAALTIVKFLGFHQVKRLTHGDPAYIAAWQKDGDKKSYNMSFAHFFEEADEDKAKELSFFSQHR